MYKIKNSFKDWYQPHESFVVRNPLFPLERFFNWKADPGDDVTISKEKLQRSLRDFYRQPLVQEALYVGSPDLHEQLLLWLENKSDSYRADKPDKIEKLELSLVKYMIRMCTRCTPYGLFASCAAGNLSGTTNIELSDKGYLQRFGRLDMDYVCELHSHLLKQDEISDQLRFFPNTSLYRAGDQWRYIEHRFKKESGRSYHLVQVEHSIYLEKIVLAAKKGRTVSHLAESILDNEILPVDAIEFIHELINSQVLVNELEPSVTGEEYFSVVLRKLKTLQHTGYVEHLERVSEKFEHLKKADGEPKNTLYPEIVQELQQLKIPLHIKTLIQVDSYRPASCFVNIKLGDELLKGASMLQLLTTDGSTRDSFTDFKAAFTSRYEGQWVSLSEVLDTESGIGYGKFTTTGMEESPLIDKLPIVNGAAAADGQPTPGTESFKWQLYQQAILENLTEVVIEDSIIEALSKKESLVAGLPDSICMMAKIHAASADNIDNGNYSLTLQPPSGPSGGNLLGRFCHLHPGIEKLTRSVLEAEELHQPEAVFAEIVHLPESRIGNILMRPALRTYEIPYLCGSTLDEKYQIPVSDLLVGVERDKVIIRSKRLGKEVIPRMTTAHNFSMTTLPVYQFLCDLQYQQIRSIGWQWAGLDDRPFLPRVRYGRFILSKAKWTLTKDEIKNFDKENDETFIQQFAVLRKGKNLPRYVLLSQGDNELMLHLENIYCLRLLLAEVNKSESVVLTESLDTPANCWIKSPDGSHAGEFIFTFSRKQTEPVNSPVTLAYPVKEKSIERFFPVGSEWLYAKIYCGTQTAERILVDIIKPFTEELLSEKIIDKYFFLRYHDAGNQIRIRFHDGGSRGFWKKIIERLQQLLQPYTTQKLVYNVQFETYQREVERYGFDTMHLSEEIFFHQSVAVLNFISMLDGDAGEQYRWQVALKAVDLFLDGFHYTIEQKLDLIRMLDKSFADEFNIKGAEQKKISERFSIHKQVVQLVMSDAWKENEDLEQTIPVFVIDNDSYRRCVEEILHAPSVYQDRQQLDRLMQSYLHMFINRIFVSNQRKTELVIYDYLFRYYESRVIREKKASNIPEPITVAG